MSDADTQALPSKPLPSLLDRCEEVLQQRSEQAQYLRLVLAFPGLPTQHADWWKQSFAGISPLTTLAETGADFVAKAAVDDDASDTAFREVLTQNLKALNERHAELGRDAVFILKSDGPTPTLEKGSRSIFLACHPMLAFGAQLAEGASDALSLEAFCAHWAQLLDRHLTAGFILIRVDNPNNIADVIPDIADHLALHPLKMVAGTDTISRQTANRKSILLPDTQTAHASESYMRLCSELSYDASAYPPLFVANKTQEREAAKLEMVSTLPPDGAIALVSGFLKRTQQAYESYASVSEPRPNIGQIREQMDYSVARGMREFFDRFDPLVEQLPEQSGALLRLAGAAHFTLLGERMHALSFITEAVAIAPKNAHWVRMLAATLLFDNNASKEAFQLLIDQERLMPLLEPAGQKHFFDTLTKTGLGKETTYEHGHALLIEHLETSPPAPVNGGKPVLIEIGTTREAVPGQGSTEKLAQLSSELGLEFITVDMDPRNTRSAHQMFLRRGFPFKAITAKGEDFLAAYDGEISYIFLDAYDFDHGQHSELRQSRYEMHLGNPIDETLCHKMHLDCAQTLTSKLTPEGLICFDDTWQDENGRWTAKGTTAMPYLLENGFTVLTARNRAALLTRSPKP